MLITNGTKTRNISSDRLPEYIDKGYKEVKTPEIKKQPTKAKNK
jgi:hypothetical protein